MPFSKGNKLARGRAKGSKNLKNRKIEELCAKHDIDPFEILLLFAKGDWKALEYDDKERVKFVTEGGVTVYEDVISPELRMNSAAQAARYLYPQKRAIEHTVEETEDSIVKVYRVRWDDEPSKKGDRGSVASEKDASSDSPG
jgi:hypothetical protein